MASSLHSLDDDNRANEFSALRDVIERRLAELLDDSATSREPVPMAMREALLAPGKRLRPLLLMLTARELGCRSRAPVDLGCAVEMIHTASLILDDLPCMDDARLRRGQPTLHRRFGEDVAVLAAVALLSRAFGVVAAVEHVALAPRLQLIETLSRTVGLQGLVQGQYQDLHQGTRPCSSEALCSTNQLKTGVLFEATMTLAAACVEVDDATREALSCFAGELGQAFQLLDDLTDGEADNGKDAHQDRDKFTLINSVGSHGAHRHLAEHLNRADAHLARVYGPDGAVSRFTHAIFARLESGASRPS